MYKLQQINNYNQISHVGEEMMMKS